MFEFIVLIAGKMIVSPRNTELGLSGSRDTTLPDSKAEFLNSVTANKQTVAKFHLAGSSILSHPKKKKKVVFWQSTLLLLGCAVMTMKGTKEQRVVSDGYSARLDLTASVVEQMGLHAAQPGVPRFSSVVPVLRAAGGEHLELLCSHVWVMWGFFPRQTLSVELFSAPPGLLRGSSAFPTWLDFSSRGRCFVELLSLSDRVVDGC